MHVRPQFASDEDAKQGKADLKPIIELKVGDEVLSWAEWKKPEDAQSYERITDVFITPNKQRTTVKITLEDGKTLTQTDGHPLKTADGLRDAILLKKGGKLLLKDSANAADKEHEVTIAELQRATETLTTFNLEVVHAHTYFVGTNGVLVHNGNRPGIKLGSHWRREYEKRTGLDWPKTDDGKNYHAHHKKPLADDGEDIYENIEPLEPKAHGKHHEQDRKRWGKMRCK